VTELVVCDEGVEIEREASYVFTVSECDNCVVLSCAFVKTRCEVLFFRFVFTNHGQEPG
jgi:hypothetical protein